MNRPLCALLILLLALIASPAPAQVGAPAQVAAPPAISRTIKEDVNPNEERKQAIRDFVQAHVQNLLNSQDPKVQSEARSALIGQASFGGMPGADEPSAAYLDLYASNVNDALKQMPADADIRTQLNAAIVAAMVAEKANNSQLRDAALAALKSENDAIALWGLKAARAVLPWALRVNDPALLEAIVPAVQAHADGATAGPIASAAYDTLSLNYVSNPRPGVDPKMLPQVIPHLQQLLEFRLDQYLNGMPPQPSAESQATTFLTFGAVWNAHNPEQQMKSIQLLTDLVTVASQLAAKGTPEQRSQLAPVIARSAAAIAVVPAVAKVEQSRDLLAVIAKVSPSTPSTDFRGYGQTVRTAVAGVPEFAQLQPPPQPKPATQETSDSEIAGGAPGEEDEIDNPAGGAPEEPAETDGGAVGGAEDNAAGGMFEGASDEEAEEVPGNAGATEESAPGENAGEAVEQVPPAQ